MAAIRFPIGGGYRYYGRRTEQRPPVVVPWLLKGIKQTMETLFKLVVGLVLGLFISFLAALFGALFFYAGWNWGLTHAVSFAHEVTLWQAFWACFGLATVGNSLRTSVKVD